MFLGEQIVDKPRSAQFGSAPFLSQNMVSGPHIVVFPLASHENSSETGISQNHSCLYPLQFPSVLRFPWVSRRFPFSAGFLQVSRRAFPPQSSPRVSTVCPTSGGPSKLSAPQRLAKPGIAKAAAPHAADPGQVEG